MGVVWEEERKKYNFFLRDPAPKKKKKKRAVTVFYEHALFCHWLSFKFFFFVWCKWEHDDEE